MSGFVRQTLVTSIVAAVLVLGIGLGIYYSTQNQTGNNQNSVQGLADQTIDATYVSTMTRISSSSTSTLSETPTQTVSIQTTSSSSPSSGGAFTYSPSSPLKILTVQALTSVASSGIHTVGFNVEFQNIGSSTIYVIIGGGSSLNATILSGPVHTQLTSSPRCEIASAEFPVGVGQNSSSITPGCWSGYTYEITQPGTIEVQLALSWSSSSSGAGLVGVTDIFAEFNLN